VEIRNAGIAEHFQCPWSRIDNPCVVSFRSQEHSLAHTEREKLQAYYFVGASKSYRMIFDFFSISIRLQLPSNWCKLPYGDIE
jgi:hypothetical protein